jgi:hypothetical protein
MADPRTFDGPVEVERAEALATLRDLLAGVRSAAAAYAERYSNPTLVGSPKTLLEAAELDPTIRVSAPIRISLPCSARIVADQARQIAEQDARIAVLEKAAPKAATKSQ